MIHHDGSALHVPDQAPSPGQSSDSTGTPQAAASKKRADGQKPSSAIGARVTLRVSGAEA